MTETKGRGRSGTDGLVWGGVLIGLGIMFLLIMNGMLPEETWHTWWPAVVIVAGAMGLAGARDPKAVGSAVVTMGIGTWLLVAVHGWYGLYWSRSWPLVLVAVGLGSLAEWVAEMLARRTKGVDHVG